MHLEKESSQEIQNRIEAVINGQIFSETEHVRFYGDINPNYLRKNIHKTNEAVRAARCLFKIADVIDRGTEEDELYFGVPYRTSINGEDTNSVELSENFDACDLAERAKLLNSSEFTKDGITRTKYQLSYHGNKLIDDQSFEATFATPMIETFNKVGCLGSLAITAGGLYAADKLGHQVYNFSDASTMIDLAYHGSIVIHGVLFSRLAGLLANDVRGNLRAKNVHKKYLEFSTNK